MKVLIAGFYTPAIAGVQYLLGNGTLPADIRLLTHDLERNQFLIAYAQKHGISYTVQHIREIQVQKWIEEFQPDVLFSLYYRDIIPQRILEILRFGGLNLHPSLLPRYRGTFSIPWAVINGETHTGFTYHYMEKEVDAGKIVLQRSIPIDPDDTAYSLYHRLIEVGMKAFGEAFHLVIHKRHQGYPQVGEPSYFPRNLPYDGYIKPHWNRDQIDRFIRAMYFPPYRGAVLKLDDQEYEIQSIDEYDALVAKRK